MLRRVLSVTVLLGVLAAGLGAMPAKGEAAGYTYQWSRPATNWTITAPTDVAVDSANNYYVLSSNHIKKYDPSGQLLGDFGANSSGGWLLSQPTGVAVDSAGNIFVCDNNGGSVPFVAKYNASGTLLTKWGSVKGTGDGQFNGLYGIAVDSAGNVYVTDDYPGSRVQKFTNSGAFVTKWALSSPQAIEVDRADNVWATSTSLNEVRKYTTSGSLVATMGGTGTAAGKFQFPAGLSVDATGDVFVADGNNQRIQKLHPNGVPVAAWGAVGGAAGYFNNPKGVAIDHNGNLLVSDNGNNRLQKFTNSCTFVSQWSDTQLGQLKSPTSGCVDVTNGDIYVLDAGNSKVQVYSRSGLLLREWATGVSTAYGIACDPAGSIYVTTTSGNTIRKYTKLGVLVATFGSTGTGDGQLSGARDVAVDPPTGSVIVCETGNKRVQVFSSAGVFVRKWGSAGTGNGQFSNPNGIALDAAGNVYVSDSTQGSVQKFTPTGAFVSKFGSYGSGAGQMLYAAGLAVDASGTVHVADQSAGRIVMYTGAGVAAGTWGTVGTGAGQMKYPYDVMFDSYGNPLVVDYGNKVLIRYATAVPTSAVSGVASGWTNADQSLTLSASGGTGPVSAYYSLNGGPAHTYSEPFTIGSEGTTTISYWAADDSGNTENAHSAVVCIDKSGPSTPSAVATLAVSPTTAVLTWDPSQDTYSGVAGYRVVRVSDGSVLASAASVPVTVTGLKPDWSGDVTVLAVDGVGNLSASSSPLRLTTPGYPLGYVPAGDAVSVRLAGGGTAVFDHVDATGTISIAEPSAPHDPPSGYTWANGSHYDIHTDAGFTGTVTITLPYGALPADIDEAGMRAFHYTGGWSDVTTSVDTAGHSITLTTPSFSEFGIGAPLPAPNVASVPASSTWSLVLLGVLGLALAGWRSLVRG